MIEFFFEWRYIIGIIFSISLAFHDSRYSIVMDSLPLFTPIKILTQAKVVKFFLYGFFLFVYGLITGDWLFVALYPFIHLVVFDVTHLLFWKKKTETFKWYLDNCIFTRWYYKVRRFFR